MTKKLLLFLAALAVAAVFVPSVAWPRTGPAVATGGNIITAPDTDGEVGQYTSLALDSSGNPVISYRDVTNSDLKVLHCGNANCTSGNSITSPDTVGDVGWYTSLVLDSNGNPVVGYKDQSNGDLSVIHCDDVDCAGDESSNITSPDEDGNVGWDLSLVLDCSDFDPNARRCISDVGNPIVSYFRGTGGASVNDLNVLHCGNTNCSSGNTIRSPDTAGTVGLQTSLALDSSGNPVISYFKSSTGDLRLFNCFDPTCSSGSITQADTTDHVGIQSSLALDSNGYPVVSYRDETNKDLKVLHCGNANCTSANVITSPDTAGSVGAASSLVLDSDGFPVISYRDETNMDLKVLHCGNANCTLGNVITSPDTIGDVGEHTSIALDDNGYPVVSYWDRSNSDLKVLHCGDPNCAPPVSPTNFDGDGCTNEQENGLDETLGGLRDYKNPWDFYDVLGFNGGPPDQIIDLPNDILGVILHFSPLGYTPGTPALVGSGIYDDFDRGPGSGPNAWNMTAPDGVIDLPNDILGVILQHNHSCQ